MSKYIEPFKSYHEALVRAIDAADERKRELIEALADAEHASWARWMDYLFSKCTIIAGAEGMELDGALAIPCSLVDRWQCQIETRYADLSEREKQSDRNEVAHILPIIERYAEWCADQGARGADGT